ncbi:DsbA family oxidoreductase [Nonomuraea wenchangensis]|uniref:Predicted dithiol-disulfide isomerase, DsbA family n=1 Tax=Nonomuraea wenchangensis TaxID=568860 RepID=A0A1I0LRN5_9ACTN|nr:DsbA family oxidoreductase [Nonomuraea wenchangensis]SEU43991.1 Predicted dithiol-disulfide isomerase, DsbA family [Nonomuraea wenchangensis]
MPQSVKVQLVMDVICAHSYLGYTRFARAADLLRAEGVQVTVTFLPFELAPGAPAGGQPLLVVLEQTFGPQAAAGALAFAERAAREGIRFEYGKAIATGTFDAHRLIADAGHQDRAEPMAERLFRAHFTDGLHIGDPATLARLAAEVGVTPGHVPSREVRARLDRVRRLGITGVPVFLIENLPPLTGSQTETTLLAALRQAAGTKGEHRDH